MPQTHDIQPLAIAQAYLAAMEHQDREALFAPLADDVVMVVSLVGERRAAPREPVHGQDRDHDLPQCRPRQLLATVVTDQILHESTNGRTVFFEANGDLVRRSTRLPYRNVSCYRSTVEGGLIVHVAEYANPVTYAKMMGLPVG